MSRLLRIAGREYVAFVKTVGFWLSMLMMPVILTVTGLAPIVMMRSTPPPTIMVVDADFAASPACQPLTGPPDQPQRAGGVVLTRALRGERGVPIAPGPEICAARSVDAMGAALRPYLAGGKPLTVLAWAGKPGGAVVARPLDYAVILYSEGGQAKVRVWSRNVSINNFEDRVTAAMSEVERVRRLEALGVDQSAIRAALSATPPVVESFSLKAERGRVADRDTLPAIAGVVMAFLLWTVIMTGAGLLLNSVIEEKSSRILEVLLSSASAPEIMIGKILGVAGVTLTVLMVWGSIGGSIALASRPGLGVAIVDLLFARGFLAYFGLFFILGYLMFATLFTTIGAFCETTREAQTLLGPMMMILVIPMVFLTQAITQPDAPILKVLSWIPPFTPFMMAARAGSGPPIWEVLGTASLMALVTAGEIWVASRAFKAGALSNARFDIKHFFASITGRAQV